MPVEKIVEGRIDPEVASRVMRMVPIPFAFLFFADVGEYTGEFARCLADFSEKLKEVSLESIEFHFERGDFEKWIRDVLGDEYLAKRISKSDGSIQGEDLRRTLQSIVKTRLRQLEEAVDD